MVRVLRGARSGKSLRLIGLVLLAVGLLAADAGTAAAQAVYGSIGGTVSDNSGGVLPGVSVTITSLERQTSDTVVTNESGNYSKERLLPGTYEVKVELTGFKAAVVPKVQVSVDTQTPLDFKLELGAMTETVEVTGGSPLLKTDRADVSTTFDQKQLTDLPTVDRNFTKFILLTPGTQQLGWQHAASENPQGSTQIQVNGQSFSGTGYQLDGTENRDPILGIIVINPNLESIGETKITSQNYDAEFGQATAGVVSVSTKSGQNNFFGSAFEFYSSDATQSRNPFTQSRADPLTGKFIPDTQKNQFGFSAGGPIQKNRTFFFADYQGTRSTQGGSRLLSVPTEAARNGDLSAYGINIYDPLSSTNPASRTQFAGNVIPADRISQQALNILALIPKPNAPGTDGGTRNNFQASGSETFNADQFDARVDHRLSDSTNLFGRYSRGKFFRDGPTAFGTGGGPEFVSLGGVSDVKNQSLALGVDHAFSSTLLTDFRFGWFRYKVNVLPFDFGTTPAADAGIPGLNLDKTFTSGLPAFFVQGDRGFNAGSGLGVNRCNCPLDQDEQQWQIVGNVTKIYGNHSFKFGVDVRRAYNLRVPSDSHRSGELTFNTDRTSLNGSGGLGIATFLLGDVTSFSRFASPNTNARERQWRHFYYAQDTWRATPKLTVNYGLRLDVINPQTVNEAGNGGWLDLNTGEILVGGVGGISLAGNVKNHLNWAPRLGATYQLNDKTVIRGGYARTYDIGVFGSLFGHSVTQNLPVLSVQSLNAPSSFDQVFDLSKGPDPAPFVDVPSNGRFPLPNNVFTRALPFEQRPPSVDAFNLVVQRQLTDTMSVEVGYVGNRGRHAFNGPGSDGPTVNPNQATLDGFGTLSYNQRQPFFSGNKTPYLNLGGAFGWTQGIDYFCSCANNWYDSMQARFTRRFSNGYSIQANYTLQKAEGEGGDYFFWDRSLNKGVQSWNRTHTLNFSLVYEVPIGKGHKIGNDWGTLTDSLLGGWQFNANQVLQSGLPFDVNYAGASAQRDTGPNRPNVSGDIKINGGQDNYFDTTPIGQSGSPYSTPAVGTFGNMEINSLRGPGYRRTDASLFKHIRLGGNRDFEVRLEAVNIFNNVNLRNPDSGIGTVTDPRTHAGVIDGTAFDNADPQRRFQFGFKFSF